MERGERDRRVKKDGRKREGGEPERGGGIENIRTWEKIKVLQYTVQTVH